MSGPQLDPGSGDPPQPPTKARTAPSPDSSGAADSLLAIFADQLDDLESARKANANRIRALVEDKGADRDDPVVQRLAAVVDGIKAVEKMAIRDLEHAMKGHRFEPFATNTFGLGLKSVGRLLGVIGDPYMKPAIFDHDTGEMVEPPRPRTVAELWSYCGYGVDEDGVAPRRRKGKKLNCNLKARTKVYLCAVACWRQRQSPYRLVYDAAYEKHADAVHSAPCAQCGGKGKPPAPIGSPLKPGHRHARALRIVSKEILRDLWTEGKRLHEEGVN